MISFPTRLVEISPKGDRIKVYCFGRWVIFMSLPEYFEVVEGIAYYRPVASVSFPEATALLLRAVDACNEIGAKKILIDTRRLIGFKIPTTVQRFNFAEQLSDHSDGIAISFLAQQEMIDPEHFGMLVATNRGVLTNVFPSEADAMSWLHASSAASKP
jgi:hypothetical protein